MSECRPVEPPSGIEQGPIDIARIEKLSGIQERALEEESGEREPGNNKSTGSEYKFHI